MFTKHMASDESELFGVELPLGPVQEDSGSGSGNSGVINVEPSPGPGGSD